VRAPRRPQTPSPRARIDAPNALGQTIVPDQHGPGGAGGATEPRAPRAGGNAARGVCVRQPEGPNASRRRLHDDESDDAEDDAGMLLCGSGDARASSTSPIVLMLGLDGGARALSHMG